MSNYGKDSDFMWCPKGYILRADDRMRRTNPESASSLEWFQLCDCDVGKCADYYGGGGFLVQCRKSNAKAAQLSKANTFCSQDMTCMKNGSCYRITGRKKEYAAQYVLGDFWGFVKEIPDEWQAVVLPWKEARSVLPRCFKE